MVIMKATHEYKRRGCLLVVSIEISMANKRTYEEIEKIEEIDRPITSTRVHGGVIMLSPGTEVSLS